jgi:hypothetical protein
MWCFVAQQYSFEPGAQIFFIVVEAGMGSIGQLP